MAHRFFLVFLVLALALSWPGGAQVPSAPLSPASMRIPVTDPQILDTWARYFYSHDWEKLQESVRETLTTQNLQLKPEKAPPVTHDFDFQHNYYRIAFVSKFAKSDGELVQFLAHDGGLEPYANRLPGVDKFFDVFVDMQGDAVLRSTYVSTRVANPLVDKIPSFIKQIDLGGLAKFTKVGPEAVVPMLFVQVSCIPLPFRRATIAISDEATAPAGLVAAELAKASTNLQKAVALREAGGSECARIVSNCLDVSLRVGLGEIVDESACPQNHHKHGAPDPSAEIKECSNAISDPGVLRCKLGKAMQRTYDSVVSEEMTCKQGTATDFAAATKVEETYKTLLGGTLTKVKRDSSYENVPLERFSLGAIASVIVSTSGDRRIKLDSGNLSANPISGTLSMATLNIHPTRFDPKTAEPTAAEKFRFFVGACLTPEFGLGGGAGYSLIRGLSINAGFAWLRVDTLRDGDQLGHPPSNLKDPFKNGIRRVIFVGFGYNF
ncbi:MAG TPA: hypothetical protein VF173_10395 [Thermoanaerobaculia bacterium]|nr:hypothetical protein [Thermoanaerobaculia bacterium]